MTIALPDVCADAALILGIPLPGVAEMALPQLSLLMRRKAAMDAEEGLRALRVNTVAARGDRDAVRDLCSDLSKQAGLGGGDTPFKRLLAKARAQKLERGAA